MPRSDEHLRAGAVLAGIGREPERQVGVDGVGALVLQLVGAQLLQQADAPALVPADVQHNARGPPSTTARKRRVQLRAAVAAQRAEHVTGQALGVHPHQHVLAVADVAV